MVEAEKNGIGLFVRGVRARLSLFGPAPIFDTLGSLSVTWSLSSLPFTPETVNQLYMKSFTKICNPHLLLGSLDSLVEYLD